MKNHIIYHLLFLFIISSISCSKTDTAGLNIDAEIISEMKSQGIPSVAACIVRNDTIVWEGYYGYAKSGQASPPTRHTLYTIMSVSKLFLSVAVMQLWEQGLIDLEADINQYLPFEVRNPHYPEKKITPYMLLNHCSGLAWPVDDDYIPDFHHFYTTEDPPLLRDWLPEYIIPGGADYVNAVWKDFAPGSMRLYSNIGTSLLGLIVEQISGTDYRDYCKTNIMDPLDMYNSGYWLGELDAELMVTPHYDNGFPMDYYTCRHYPAGFLSCNTVDFSHFAIAMLNHGKFRNIQILKSTTFEKMLTIQNPEAGLSYLWWHIIGNGAGHKGGGTGFSTWAEWDFDNNSALFIFSSRVNESVPPGGRIYELVKYQMMLEQ